MFPSWFRAPVDPSLALSILPVEVIISMTCPWSGLRDQHNDPSPIRINEAPLRHGLKFHLANTTTVTCPPKQLDRIYWFIFFHLVWWLIFHTEQKECARQQTAKPHFCLMRAHRLLNNFEAFAQRSHTTLTLTSWGLTAFPSLMEEKKQYFPLFGAKCRRRSEPHLHGLI